MNIEATPKFALAKPTNNASEHARRIPARPLTRKLSASFAPQVAYDREVQLFGASGGPSRAWEVSTIDGVALFGLDRGVVRREIAGLPSKAPPASAAAPPKQLPRPAAAAPPPKVPRRPPGAVPKPGKDAQR